MIDGFLKEVNDYSCIYQNDKASIKELSHYTNSVEAAINISKGCFWATEISDFDDGYEGKLILRQINEIINDHHPDIMNEDQIEYVQDYIGNEDKIEKFIKGHKTNILSLSLNLNSDFMWEEYAGKDGYNIILDKNIFIEDMHFFTPNGGPKGGNYIKHAPVVYNTEKQIRLILEETNRILKAKCSDLTEKRTIYWLLYHLMFVGNYYKRNEDKGQKSFEKEEEYRVSTNFVAVPEGNENELPTSHLNEKNREHPKRYIELYFDPSCVKKIVCSSAFAKRNIEGKVSDILVELKK